MVDGLRCERHPDRRYMTASLIGQCDSYNKPMMLMPVPVVVDADVLIRNVEYTIRKCLSRLHALNGAGRFVRGSLDMGDHRGPPWI